MPRPRKNELFAAKYFSWILLVRNGVFWADGRSNTISVGRHSLGSRIREEAIDSLSRLDLTMAIQHGLAEPEALVPIQGVELPLAVGRKLYEEYVSRSIITGGTRKSSQKRYRTILDKFLSFLESKQITTWNRVTTKILKQYLDALEHDGYSYATQYVEGTTVKQILNFLVLEKRLPAEAKIALKLLKPQGTNTYCWRPVEVMAIREFTQAKSELRWLHDVLTTLTFTGLRIAELIALRWSDIDFARGMIRLVDESTSRRRGQQRVVRTLKGRRDRSFPINPELRPILESISHESDGYVFHGPMGARLKADTVRNALVRDVLTPLSARFPTPAGEIGFASGRLHSYRHFFCSLSANSNVPQQVLMQWLGHRDSKLVAHYYHLSDDEARRQMQKLKLAGGDLASDKENG